MPDQYTWTSAAGTVVELNDWAAGFYVTDVGGDGLRSPSYELSTAQYAGVDGSTVLAIRAAPNEPNLGLYIEAPDRQAFRVKARALVHELRPQAGPGQLTVRTDWGDVRTLTCYCTDGMQGSLAKDVIGPGTWWKLLLKFYAPDPWWYGDTQTISAGLGAPTNFFPIFPFLLSQSTVQGDFTVDLSDADAPSYPVWTITGPGTSLTLTNNTTGRQLMIVHTLSAGQNLVVDTRPGQRSVRAGDGTNLLGSVSGEPQLWPLIEGINDISASLLGATSASRIDGVYAARYAGI